MQHKIDRRTLLRGAATGTALAGLTAALGSSVHALSRASNKKLLIIFQRGGNDGLNTIVPTGAAPQMAANGQYAAYTALRPSLHQYPSNSTAVPQAYRAIPLTLGANTHSTAELHPALQQLSSIYSNGDLACIHRVGAMGLTLSHFTAQHHWETGRPLDISLGGNTSAGNYHRGWATRFTGSMSTLCASLSDRQQQAFDTTQDAEIGTHIRRLFASTSGSGSAYSYRKPGMGPHSLFQTMLPLGLQAQAAYGGGTNPPLRSPLDKRMREVTAKTVTSESQITGLQYTQFGGTYPSSGTGTGGPSALPSGGWVTEFGDRLKDAAALLKLTTTQVVGVEIGGWDTHSGQTAGSGQARALGQHQQRLAVLGAGMKAIYDDVHLDPNSPDVITLVVSEFGRTMKQNSSAGTDHGWATTAFVMGTGLKNNGPRVFNFDATDLNPWHGLRPGDLTNGNAFFSFSPTDPGYDLYTVNRTDYRAILREILEKHFGITSAAVDQVLPDVLGEEARTVLGLKQWYSQLGFL